MGDIIVICLLAAIIAIAARSVIKQHKNGGCAGCSCGCCSCKNKCPHAGKR